MNELIATGIIPAVFCLAVGYWAVTAFGRWLDRHDAEQQQNLATGIADERRHIEDEPTEEIVLDPPVTRLYVATPGVSPGWTLFRDGLVHIDCLGPYLRDGTRPCTGCANHFGHVRTWSDEELAVARLVARLGRTAGIPAGRAAELARMLLSGDDLPMRCPLGQNLFIEVWPEPSNV